MKIKMAAAPTILSLAGSLSYSIWLFGIIRVEKVADPVLKVFLPGLSFVMRSEVGVDIVHNLFEDGGQGSVYLYLDSGHTN